MASPGRRTSSLTECEAKNQEYPSTVDLLRSLVKASLKIARGVVYHGSWLGADRQDSGQWRAGFDQR